MSQTVKPGYKQTEVGVIPVEWEEKTIDQIAFVTSGKRLPLGSTLVAQTTPHPYIRVTDMRPGTVELSEIKYVPEDVFPAIKRYRIYCEDIFISVAGSLGIVGKVPRELHGANLTENADRITNITCSQDYLLHVLMSPLIQNTIDSLQTVGAQPKLALTRIRKFVIPHPSLPEQRAIATALSDVDALLAAQDRLIDKQRDLKQAAMQQLLTGQTRLPGFTGKWETKTLNEICWFQEGPGVRNAQFTTTGIKLLNGTNIYRGGLNLDTTTRFISEKEAYGPYSHFMADEGDIVLASSGITVERLREKVAFVRRENLPFCMNTSTIRFKPHDGKLCPKFLFQFLVGDTFKLQIGGVATGSAQLNFGPSHVAKVEIMLPPLPEQTAIATVLSDMDLELAALEQRRDKTRALKQGMMQELLTGKTRLL